MNPTTLVGQSSLHRSLRPSLDQRSKSTQLNFMGSDGGILGIGAPELVRESICSDCRFVIIVVVA